MQDVIRAAQWLYIQYIWIDTMCIYQGSKDDWAKESTRMSTVYRNGTINIAATVAQDGRAGCFPRRNSTPKSCVVQTAWNDFKNGRFGVYIDRIWPLFKAENKSLPLLSRGWVLQEMLLAPRVLHLAGSQLVWECRTVDACEEAAFGVQTAEFQHIPSAKWKAFAGARGQDCVTCAAVGTASKSSGSKNSGPEQRDIREFWREILRDYTGKSFTYHTDKLVALSGIARLMANSLGPEYYAGLWGRTMASELCWEVVRSDARVERPGIPEDLPPRPSPYRAPSWSWACLEERILGCLYGDPRVDILDCHVQTATDDMMGAVTGGTLRVCGRLLPLEIQLDGKSEKDCFSVLCNGLRWTFFGDKSNADFTFTMALDCKPPSLRFHCLPVLGNRCLLLSPTGKQRGQFERYGLVVLTPKSGSMWDRLLPVKNEDWMEFESQLEDGRCTLTIV
jgi:hypothetical protein